MQRKNRLQTSRGGGSTRERGPAGARRGAAQRRARGGAARSAGDILCRHGPVSFGCVSESAAHSRSADVAGNRLVEHVIQKHTHGRRPPARSRAGPACPSRCRCALPSSLSDGSPCSHNSGAGSSFRCDPPPYGWSPSESWVASLLVRHGRWWVGLVQRFPPRSVATLMVCAARIEPFSRTRCCVCTH